MKNQPKTKNKSTEERMQDGTDKVVGTITEDELLDILTGVRDNELLEERISALPERNLTEDEAMDIIYGLGCNSFNRMGAFIEISSRLHGKVYWHVLSEAYQGSDDLFQYKDQIKKLFSSPEPHRKYLMTPEERQYLKQLPDKVTAYRGMTVREKENESFGISWTLSKRTAEFFAYTYRRNQATKGMETTVTELKVPKNQILAYYNGRNEDEIIYIV